ncbi:MAG: 6-phosphogluconolactonase [Candidatus Gracilibacteria bacterium]|jgi:6-phosphogluconolactonase
MSTKKSPKTIHIALSGGKTPIPFYKDLAKSKNTDFSKIEFYIVDERYVSLKNAKSNFKMINSTLISKIKCRKFHYFDTSLPIEKAIKAYEKEVGKVRFDMAVLGIGDDGHFASIFPKSKAITSKKSVEHTQTKKFEVKDRLTLTAKKILQSKQILVLLKNKPSVLKELVNKTKTIQEFPAHILKKHKNLEILSI